MLTEKTVNQILWVLELTKKNFNSGLSIAKSYQKAVGEVADRNKIRYQTIADGCRRRLGLDDVGQLVELLEDWLDGRPEQLKELLILHAEDYKEKINAFFVGGRATSESLTLKVDAFPGSETLLIRLSHQMFSQLKDLADFNGKTVQAFSASIIEDYVSRQYVNHVMNVINSMPKEVKKQLLDELTKTTEGDVASEIKGG